MYKHIVRFGKKLRQGLKEMIEKKIEVRGQQIYVKIHGDPSLPTVVFLHGFTGTSSTWDEIATLLKARFSVVAVDLTGHGNTTMPINPKRYSMAEQVEDLEALCIEMNLSTFVLVGYSMGGRIALAYAYQYPNRVATLIVESASPGLKTAQERQERQQADARLAKRIQEEGIAAFVAFWEDIPLFASQKKMPLEKQEKVRKERLMQHPDGLANSLLGIGTGSQPSYWDKLSSLQVPILLITGEIDEKFVFIAREMSEMLPLVTHQVIKDVGHAIHVEKPTLFATIVEEHINDVTNLRGIIR